MVFYFTGTGNSLYAAKMLEEEAISIPRIMNSGQLEFTAERIGLVCPIYGHEMPAMVKEFLQRAAFHTDYLYVVLTYGARHANAVELADGVLKRAGKQAAYITTLLMADNFLPAFDMQAEMKLDKGVEERLAQIRDEILLRKVYRQRVSPQDRAMHASYLAAVKNAPETFWADFALTDECIGCGICTKVCPAGRLRLENQRAVQTQARCQACYACIHACPKLAIRLKIPEKNRAARYRNAHVSLGEIVTANHQSEN